LQVNIDNIWYAEEHGKRVGTGAREVVVTQVEAEIKFGQNWNVLEILVVSMLSMEGSVQWAYKAREQGICSSYHLSK
jgi:hypothetical protein